MNDKLARFAGINVMRGRGSTGRGSCPSDALVSVTKSDEKKGRRIVRISLHNRAVEQLTWQLGDRISMNVTEGGAIVLDRDNQHGRLLCKATGKAGRKYVRFVVVPEFYEVIPVGEGLEVEIDNGRMAFCL